MFYMPDRVGVFASSYLPHNIGTYISTHMPEQALDATKGSVDPQPWYDELPYRAAYSLDLFLPLVNLHIDENWQPHGPVLQLYAILHATVGWLVVPLLLAALAGVMRR